MTDEMLKKIKQLPPLPESAMQIEAIYQNPSSSLKDMVKVLEKDPLLMADILRSANSPLYGFSREITSVTQAAGLFGMGTIRGFALATIVKKSFILDLSIYSLNADSFSDLSKKQHALVTSWLLKKESSLLNILSPAAFLIEIGKVLIAQQVASDKNEQNFKELLASGEKLSEVEKKFCGCTTAEVSANIFEHWKFEQKLVDTIRYSENVQEAPEEVARCSKILQVIRHAILPNSTITKESIVDARDLVQTYALDLESFDKAVENITQ